MLKPILLLSILTSFLFANIPLLNQITLPNNTTTTYTYDALSRQTKVTYPNGVSTNYEYDSRNRVTKIEHTNSNNDILQSFSYTYDEVGNRLSETRNDNTTINYEYNEVNQLIKATITNDPNGNNTTTTYSYDAVGNLISKTIQGTTHTYTYDANDRLIQKDEVILTYDNNGNLIDDGTNSYEYDDKNRLTKVITPNDTIEYIYDAQDNRIAKITNNITTTYLIDTNTPFAQVITESKENRTEIHYTYGNDLISDNTHYFLTDALGSTRGLVDSDEELTDSYDYKPYGELLAHNGTSDNDFLFTGEQLDQETDNYYLRARYYSPNFTRFLSRDSYDGTLDSPLSQNHYLYTHSNPVNYIDPSGHFFMGGGIGMMSIIASATWEGLVATMGTLEQGAFVALQAKTLVVGLNLRQEAIESIITGIKKGISQEGMNEAYKKYSYATEYISLTTGNAYEAFKAFGWTQATFGFAKALTKIPMARYSTLPDRYLSKVNSLNRMITVGLDKVVKDKLKYDEVNEIVKGMTSLALKIGFWIGGES